MNYDRSVKEFGYDYNDINTLDFIAIDFPPGTTVVPGSYSYYRHIHKSLLTQKY